MNLVCIHLNLFSRLTACLQVIGVVSATDADAGRQSEVVYSLSAADAEYHNESSWWFSVNSSSGHITARVSFDREFVDRFQFVVLATSGSATAQVTDVSWSLSTQLEIIQNLYSHLKTHI